MIRAYPPLAGIIVQFAHDITVTFHNALCLIAGTVIPAKLVLEHKMGELMGHNVNICSKGIA